MGQTTKKIRLVEGTQAEYDASPSTWAQDIFFCTDSRRIYVRGTEYVEQCDRLDSQGRSAPAEGTPPNSGMQMFEAYNNGYPYAYGNVLRLRGKQSAGASELLLSWSGTTNAVSRIYYRNKRDNVSTWSEWKAFAFTDDKPAAATSADSATKLATARTLWGKSFNGTANVSGDMTGVGKLSATGEVVSTAQNAFRLAAGNYGVILRNDGAQFYFLLTAKGQAAAGGWNNLRPFFINLQTGLVTMQNGLAVNGGLSANTASVSDDLHVGGEAAIDGDLHVGGNIDYPQVAHARLLIPYELYSLATGTQLADSHFASTEWKTLAGFKTALEKFSQYGTAVYVELGNSSSNTRRTQAVFQYRENTAGKYYTFAFSTSTSNVGDLSARIQFNLTKSTGVLQFGKSGV